MTTTAELPETLVELVRQGQTVLVLGAGASFGARGEAGEEAPSGKVLAAKLADQFLGGAYKDRPLGDIAELSESESDRRTVQEFIAEMLQPLKPARFHCLLPTFKWHGIATTNYDTIVEQAYESTEDRVQQVGIFLSDEDRVEDVTRSPAHVLLVKLHGCIRRIGDSRLPLIITPDQYLTHRDHRHALFDLLCQWGREKTVVFVGQDLSDADLRQVLLTIESRVGTFRPRYFLVRPNMTEPERRLWERRKIDVIDMTFEAFLRALDASIPKEVRPLLAEVRRGHPVARHFAEDSEMSPALQDALDTELEYVHPGVSVPSGAPNDFYRGFDLGWYPIVEKLDLRRPVVDELLLDVVLADERERPANVELYVIKGEAGSGKTVLLRRLAWETANDAGLLAVYAAGGRDLHWEPIQELAALVRQRLFLFVDDVAQQPTALDRLLTQARRLDIPLTVIASESYSLWDIYCGRLDDFVSREFAIRRLSEHEIGQLVDLLEAHDSLGTRLDRMTRDEQIDEFRRVADRQLLVALHQATRGEPLEIIVSREYQQLRPKAAQALYLTVCVLNRLKVPVRAGLISRVHGIPFEQFERELLGPLDHVVKPRIDPIVKDYMYEARHSEIADMVFRRVLTNPEDRFREYSRLLQEMNLAFKTDEAAFDGLMKGRSIVELFPDYEMASQLYDLAERLAPSSGELFHQRAIYELRRQNPSTERAYSSLEKAWDLSRDRGSITHTFAELALVQAETTDSPIRREKYLERATELSTSLLGRPNSGRFARHTLVKIGISRLKQALREGLQASIVEELVADIEGHLERGYQQNPSDSYLISSEADLRELLKESGEAISALEDGFRKNPRDSFLAIRLAKAYEAQDRIPDAATVIDTALKANHTDRRLNYRKAMLLRKQGERDASLLMYYLHRAFTPGDDHYDAQFWYARYAYELGEPDRRREAKEIFRSLRKARVPYETRVEVRDRWMGPTGPRVFHGTVRRRESAYGQVELDGDQDWVFMHVGDLGEDIWSHIRLGARVTAQGGFSMQGAVALDVEVQR